MKIINDFGIEPVLLGAQIINFLILLFILKKFLYKPILNLLQKRQDEIKEGIKKTEDAQKKIEKAIMQEKTILKNANASAKKIVENATRESIELSKQIQYNTNKQAETILSEARINIAQEVKDAEKKLTENIADTSLKFLQRALKQMLTEREQEKVIKTALKKFKEVNQIS